MGVFPRCRDLSKSLVIRKGRDMSIDIDTVRGRIESWEDKLDKWDGVIRVADTTLVDTEKVLAKADEVLDLAQVKAEEARELAEEKLELAREVAEENKRHLPKVAIGLAVVGLAVGVLVVLKKRRKAAAEWQVMEQPEETFVAPAAQEVKKQVTVSKDVDQEQEDAADLADVADVDKDA